MAPRGVASKSLLGLVALQVLFAVIIAIVTSTQLDGESCYLNVSGSVCNFAYVTSGFSLFFSLLLAVGAGATLRAIRTSPLTSFLPAECGSLAAFATFWWVVAAVTFTQRGKQASDAGLPAGSARSAVVALSWLEFVFFLLATGVVSFDRAMHARHSWRTAAAAQQLLDEEQSEGRKSEQSSQYEQSSQFKQAAFELSSSTPLSALTTPLPATAAVPAPLATAV